MYGRVSSEPSMNRYARIVGKLPREIVLLRSLPCVWSRCTFCDYIEDNTTDLGLIQRVADEELAKVTGEFGRLEVINSGSLDTLRRVIAEKVPRRTVEVNLKAFDMGYKVGREES